MMQLPGRTHYISGRREGAFKRGYSKYINTHTVTGLILLMIALSLIYMPEMQESAKSLLLVAFTCAAMLQGN